MSEKAKKIKVELELNQYQIELIRSWVEGTQDNLHDQRNEWNASVPDYDLSYKTTYGTSSYDEAQELLYDIANQLPAEAQEFSKEETVFFYCNRKGNIKDLEAVRTFPPGATHADVQKAFEEWLEQEMDIGWSMWK